MIDYISKKTSRIREKRLSTTVLHLPIDRAVAAAAVGSDAWMPAAGMIATSVSALPATDGDGSDGRNRRHRSPSSSGRSVGKKPKTVSLFAELNGTNYGKAAQDDRQLKRRRRRRDRHRHRCNE